MTIDLTHFGTLNLNLSQRRNPPRWEAGALWLLPASPGPWWSSEKAFAMRSSRMPARAEVLGRLDDTSGVAVVD